MDTNIEKVISVLNKVNGFEKIRKEDCKIKRLGGMTNIVHLVENQNINPLVTDIIDKLLTLEIFEKLKEETKIRFVRLIFSKIYKN